MPALPHSRAPATRFYPAGPYGSSTRVLKLSVSYDTAQYQTSVELP
jgi:hypothetical protein